MSWKHLFCICASPDVTYGISWKKNTRSCFYVFLSGHSVKQTKAYIIVVKSRPLTFEENFSFSASHLSIETPASHPCTLNFCQKLKLCYWLTSVLLHGFQQCCRPSSSSLCPSTASEGSVWPSHRLRYYIRTHHESSWVWSNTRHFHSDALTGKMRHERCLLFDVYNGFLHQKQIYNGTLTTGELCPPRWSYQTDLDVGLPFTKVSFFSRSCQNLLLGIPLTQLDWATSSVANLHIHTYIAIVCKQ